MSELPPSFNSATFDRFIQSFNQHGPCDVCPQAHGMTTLCPAGREIYIRMLDDIKTEMRDTFTSVPEGILSDESRNPVLAFSWSPWRILDEERWLASRADLMEMFFRELVLTSAEKQWLTYLMEHGLPAYQQALKAKQEELSQGAPPPQPWRWPSVYSSIDGPLRKSVRDTSYALMHSKEFYDAVTPEREERARRREAARIEEEKQKKIRAEKRAIINAKNDALRPYRKLRNGLIWLLRNDGMTYKEIGQIFDISSEAVRRTIGIMERRIGRAYLGLNERVRPDLQPTYCHPLEVPLPPQ